MNEEALRAEGLGKLYKGRWALQDLTFSIPAGRIVALVGPNGAGKSTLLHLAAGLITPSAGSVRVFGDEPAEHPTGLARLAFLAQDKPLYPGLTVEETLHLGARLNPMWDDNLARERLDGLGISLRARIRQLSGGQRTQVALGVALSKRADLLLLDEPMADLDPLARHQVMQSLMAAVAETGMTVVMSSHVLAELEEVCDHLLLLSGGRVQLSGDIEDILDEHAILSGSAGVTELLAEGAHKVVRTSTGDRGVSALVRLGTPVTERGVTLRTPTLEELVLAYMRGPEGSTGREHRMEEAR
ncbi:ABC transporter ATP-binding protein [Streptomyces lavendulae subsp. lavendulae]|uniref:ABC transporter ATP-binding protein n=1 Tax=Streptomyces lavendulae TaxID=1914 RepID=UPI0024A48801|nr:ABC transporter ATP-binding protein [Streptomyces lavendulae]GLV88224.1 ABC transporter ATP-binding protein [Streptomyces lavendulae subsp. lavendulae]